MDFSTIPLWQYAVAGAAMLAYSYAPQLSGLAGKLKLPKLRKGASEFDAGKQALLDAVVAVSDCQECASEIIELLPKWREHCEGHKDG